MPCLSFSVWMTWRTYVFKRTPYWSARPILTHDDVIIWKHFLCHWPFMRGIRRLPGNSPHKGKWHGALMFFYLRLGQRLSKQSKRQWFRCHYDVIVMGHIFLDISMAPMEWHELVDSNDKSIFKWLTWNIWICILIIQQVQSCVPPVEITGNSFTFIRLLLSAVLLIPLNCNVTLHKDTVQL